MLKEKIIEDDCDMASAGMIGTIGMWAGIICALMVTLMMVLPMAGVDAMDAVSQKWVRQLLLGEQAH